MTTFSAWWMIRISGNPIKFLREREIVHFQRFGEGLRLEQEQLDSRNFYAFNPEFDRRSK